MSITGNLDTLELSELLQWLAHGQKTGALVVNNHRVEKKIFYRAGKIISSESNNPDEHLGSFLVREGLIDESTLSRAVKLQESTQILLGKVLVTLGSISDDELHRVLQRKTEESIYELFTWTEGEFRFEPDNAPEHTMAGIEIEVTNVVLEGMRRIDEARHEGKEIGPAEPPSDIRDLRGEFGDELFQDLEFDEVAAQQTDDSDESTGSAELTVPASLESDPPTGDISGGYYGTAQGSKKPRAQVLAAAAGVAALLIGGSIFFFMRPDPSPTDENLADIEATVERPDETVPENLEIAADRLTPGAASAAMVDTEQTEALVAAAAALETLEPPQDEKLRAEYESQLEELRQQLAAARKQAADREMEVQLLQSATEVAPQDNAEAQLASREPTTVSLPAEEPLQEETDFGAGGDEPQASASALPPTDVLEEISAPFTDEMETDLTPPVEEDSSNIDVAEDVIDTVIAPAQVTQPVLLSKINPRYPSAALRLGKEAIVTVRLLIDEKGKVSETERVGDLAGMGFDQAAISAARNTKWQAGTRDGSPAEMWTELRIQFRK